MPELLRSVIVRLCGAFGSHGSRRAVHLPLRVSWFGTTPTGGGQRSCAGYTRDISGTGLSFVLPTTRVGGRHVFGEGGTVLRVELELAGGSVGMKVTPTRYDLYEGRGGEQGYLIGARILDMSCDDRARYYGFLRAPHGGANPDDQVETSGAVSAVSQVG